jgi:hypothetical protein
MANLLPADKENFFFLNGDTGVEFFSVIQAGSAWKIALLGLRQPVLV